MHPTKFTAIGIVLALAAGCRNFNDIQSTNQKEDKMEAIQKFPAATDFVSSPLRNRIRLELNAPVAEVWNLVGDPTRMPEYSEGLHKVETKNDENGHCTEFVCHFKPQEPGDQGTIHRVFMKWYEPNRGWAALDEEPNAYGLSQSLALITVEGKGDVTVLNWDMHFNTESKELTEMNKADLEQALNQDIAQRLIQRFGGRVLESYVEGKEI
jgi:carbon monoxide dehydrogenase subunit G